MQLHRSLEDLRLPGAWLTVGTYDGVHRGHQAILTELVQGAHAAGLPAVVLTFEPHPSVVLRPGAPLKLLTSIEERAGLLGGLGVDMVIAYPFDQAVAARTAEDFVALLKEHIGFSRFLVGYDFAMGRARSGDVPALQRMGAALGFEVQVFDPVGSGADAVSSSRIRAALEEGAVGAAAEMLGRPYALAGKVVEGSRRGRSIGVPTANISVSPDRLVPGAGVYACRATVDGEIHRAAANIGSRPTFEEPGAAQTVEAHLLDFDRDIYGREVRLDFAARLRGEQKFPGIDALVAQIRADVARTREMSHESLP